MIIYYILLVCLIFLLKTAKKKNAAQKRNSNQSLPPEVDEIKIKHDIMDRIKKKRELQQGCKT